MSRTPVTTRALLVDAGVPEALNSFLEARNIAMLPVGGKPILQFWCERLNLMGFTSLHLVLSHQPDQVRGFAGSGARWGLEITVTTVREGMAEGEMLRTAAGAVSGPTLVAKLNHLPLKGLAGWLDTVIGQSVPVAAQGTELPDSPGILDERFFDAESPSARWLPPAAPVVRRIEDPRSLWQASLDLLSGSLEDPLPPGFELEPGVRVGQRAQIKPGIRLRSPCRIGEASLVRPQVSLGPDVVVGNHCIIDEASELSRTVVFDHSFIGSHAEFRNALVDGCLVYRVDTGVAVWVGDPMIVGSTAGVGDSGPGWMERLGAGLLLALLSLPAAALAGLKSLRGHRPWQKEAILLPGGRDLAGDVLRRELPVVSLDARAPALRKFPWLWQVMRGRLGLFGVTARSRGSEQTPDWARHVDLEAPGVISLSDVTGAGGQEDPEAILVADSYYLATRGPRNNLVLLGRWLLRGWRPRRAEAQ